MKKNLLSLSIGAAIAGLTLAGAANAAVSLAGTNATGTVSATLLTQATPNATLELNPGGIGHIGVIPYFSTQAGNQTLFSITNSDAVNGKAVKVRFRSAANSDDIFDFTLFLSPGDIWTANISRDPTTGTSRLVTTDNSCTLPGIAALNRGFVDARLPAGFTAAQKAEWTREGYVEVLTMADIPPTTTGTAAAPDLYYATKHVGGVAPCTDSVLSKLTVPANFANEGAARGLGFDTPTTGLYTNAFIINTANAFLSWSNESTAIQAVTVANNVSTPARGRFVFAAQTNDAVQTTAANLLTADPLLVGGFTAAGATVTATVAPLEFDFPDLSTPYTGTATLATAGTGSPAAQATRLSGSLATTSVKNDYSTLAAIGSKTDFTFSLPTRRYHAVVSYSGAPNGVGGNGTPVAGPLAVYSTDSTAITATDRTFFIASNTSLLGNLLCVNTGSPAPVTAYDRSERTVTTGNGAVVSPGQGTAPLSFCGEVSVLTINGNAANPAGAGVLGASVAAKDVFTSYQEGWLTIATPGPATIGGNAGGLPVLGSAYTSAIGSPANGVSTNYSWAFKHKTTPSLG